VQNANTAKRRTINFLAHIEQRRQNNLQNLLQPIANDWDINIDVLIKMAHEMSTFL